jgi:hypothetical protein
MNKSVLLSVWILLFGQVILAQAVVAQAVLAGSKNQIVHIVDGEVKEIIYLSEGVLRGAGKTNQPQTNQWYVNRVSCQRDDC